jgi:hypothetical protein
MDQFSSNALKYFTSTRRLVQVLVKFSQQMDLRHEIVNVLDQNALEVVPSNRPL